MGEEERRIVVIGQTLLQLKKKKQFYPWIFTFLIKKKKKNLIPFSVCSPLGQVLDPS